jgi:hypothetical protein
LIGSPPPSTFPSQTCSQSPPLARSRRSRSRADDGSKALVEPADLYSGLIVVCVILSLLFFALIAWAWWRLSG